LPWNWSLFGIPSRVHVNLLKSQDSWSQYFPILHTGGNKSSMAEWSLVAC
jgi:hypothetical protein